MAEDRNPQREQMADESMVRGLRAQADAIWPEESRLVRGYTLPENGQALDVGCGTGEFVRRVASLFPTLRFLGVDVIESHLELARQDCAELGDRAEFRVGDAFRLDLEDDRFDLVVNRHMLQSIPRPADVIAELIRVLRPGGRIHLLAEDYAMIYFHPVDGDTDRFWQRGPIAFGQATGTDLRIGRRVPTILHRAGMQDVETHYVTVDTTRAREPMTRIWEAWRDGYAEPIAANTELSREEVDRYWEAMLACLNDPGGYAVWHVPVITARKP